MISRLNTIAAWGALLFFITAAFSPPAGAEPLTPKPELLVSTAWLAANAQTPGQGDSLRIVDVRGEEAYREGHIPGAVNLPSRLLFANIGGVEGMLPPADNVALIFGRAGIGNDTVVVAYDDSGGLFAARLFWALDYLGQGKGRLLDGGRPLWRREKRPVSRETPPVPSVRFRPRPQPQKIADLAWMRAHMNAGGISYVDARSTREYRGITQYSRYRGHIPGALSMEWKRHLRSDGTMRPAGEILSDYRELGADPEKEVAVYCQIHVRAARSYFTLQWLGYAKVRGYDGSWEEWGNRDDTPKELF